MKKLIELTLAAMFLVFSPIAGANIIYTWNADGVTESASQQGTAIFNFASADSFTVTLMNNVDPTDSIVSELDGILFSFSTAPTLIDLLSITPSGVIDCTASPTSPCEPGAGASPYGWAATANGGDITLGAGYAGGNFAYHPYGIVNQNYHPGQLGDPDFNPLLTGPVTYTFAMTGLTSIPEVTSATFLFGNLPDEVIAVDPPSSVPEPGSLALIGAGLLGMVFAARRKRGVSQKA